jgi:GT2 family glycosyltransferase
MWESDAFPIGHLYGAVAEQIEADAYLFLDDDHTLTDAFEIADLRKAWRSYAAWSLPVRTGEAERVIRDASKCGGQLVRADAYVAAGGHGSDYLEDIELSLRLSWAGTAPKRYPEKITVHHQGISGGYRTGHPKIEDYPTSEDTHSRLSDRYECIEESESAWYGYREVQ